MRSNFRPKLRMPFAPSFIFDLSYRLLRSVSIFLKVCILFILQFDSVSNWVSAQQFIFSLLFSSCPTNLCGADSVVRSHPGISNGVLAHLLNRGAQDWA